ncbi:MAG: hypothetical protein HYU99_01850 [Deltaproteobacteria bacterium]|nr:hypothetical protein [Deltaproteobacteria bacterium]
MAKRPKYRLEVLLKMKERAKRAAQLALARAIKALEEEKEKLKRLKDKKEEIRKKREKARSDMRDKVAGGQSRIKESQFHLNYIMKLEEDEKAIDREIEEQKEAVAVAEEKLKRARRDYVDAAQELNIMEKHKELWQKKERHILSALENKQMNELANTVYQMNRMRAV